jgi:uncharacterized protein YbaR (Trm112 family)
MTLDHRLLELQSAVCKGPLQPIATTAAGSTNCSARRPPGLPVRDGIPVMLEHEARNLDAADTTAASPG